MRASSEGGSLPDECCARPWFREHCRYRGHCLLGLNMWRRLPFFPRHVGPPNLLFDRSPAFEFRHAVWPGRTLALSQISSAFATNTFGRIRRRGCERSNVVAASSTRSRICRGVRLRAAVRGRADAGLLAGLARDLGNAALFASDAREKSCPNPRPDRAHFYLLPL